MTAEPVLKHSRILFLRDSYTEGIGYAKACNYPNVAEKVLRSQLGNIEALNAGVKVHTGAAQAMKAGCGKLRIPFILVVFSALVVVYRDL